MSDRPKIVVRSDELPLIVDQAEQYLIESDSGVYQRDGKLVRIGKIPAIDARPSLLFVLLVKETLIEIFTAIISWSKIERKKEIPTGCPGSVAATYLGRVGRWRVPTVKAIITAPTMRADGSVLDKPGYDKATGLYYVPQGVEFPTMPDAPTKDVARDCLNYILSAVSEIPFMVDEKHGNVSRSVFLSAVLSALIRPILPAIPLHGFDAPTPGAEKSILVNGISYLMTGNPASPVTQGSEEETTKVLSAALQSGLAIVSFDNCEYPLGGAMLCQAVSEPVLSVRVFGTTELRKITNTAMYFATGNNLTFTGDITRRAMRSTIDPSVSGLRTGISGPSDRML